MSWEQKILNASVSVNRCVWAINLRKFPDKKEHDFNSIVKRNNYVKLELKEAILNLTNALNELDNKLKF
jgi:hypothetical protein